MNLMRIAAQYLRKYSFLTVIAMVLIIAASFFEGASFGMLIPLIQSMTQGTAELFRNIPVARNLNFFFLPASQTKTISFVFILVFLLILLKNFFGYLSNIFIARLRANFIRDLRVSLMNNLLEYDIKFFDNTKMGQIIGNITMEVERMGDFVRAVLRFTADWVRVAVYVLILFLISWKVSLVIFLLIASVLLPIELIMHKLKRIGEKISQAIEGYNYKLTEILNGIRLIKICGSTNLEKEKFRTEADNIRKFQYKNAAYYELIIPLSEALILGLVLLCALALINVAKIDIMSRFSFIATYLVILARMLTRLNTLNSNRSVAIGNLAAFGRYQKMHDKEGKITISDGSMVLERLSESIEIKDVNFSYTAGNEILKSVNIRIPRGKITALVGISGAGKSTVANLIPRFYDIDSGKILIDGINLKDIVLEKWRHKIGFVSQETFIFNMPVKDNISYGHAGVSENKIIEAANTANAHDFIMNLPEGYNTVLGERGVKLSGGQRQRISIARAIIHDPEVLILDEATSSLDTETERLITAAINRLTKNRTVIAIAHRLSTILHADNIVVLDKGRVVEEGRHEDLLRKNGLYKKLYDVQFNG